MLKYYIKSFLKYFITVTTLENQILYGYYFNEISHQWLTLLPYYSKFKKDCSVSVLHSTILSKTLLFQLLTKTITREWSKREVERVDDDNLGRQRRQPRRRLRRPPKFPAQAVTYQIGDPSLLNSFKRLIVADKVSNGDNKAVPSFCTWTIIWSDFIC